MRGIILGCLVGCAPASFSTVRQGRPEKGETADTGGEGGGDGSGSGSGSGSGGSEGGSGGGGSGGVEDTGQSIVDPEGVDVSGWDDVVDWDAVAGAGLWFAFVKATEGTYYTNDDYSHQYPGAADAGLLRGAYHFAIPDDSSGAAQAQFFVENGGDWTDDGQTLPGVLDIEYNPYGETCYDFSQSEMATWIADFTDTYRALTGRAAIIYTTANWWDTCVGSTAFGAKNPLWVAHYGADHPSLPDGWSDYAFWQYTSEGDIPGIDIEADVNLYKGTLAELSAYARGN